jgi:hypothetical protein
MAAAGYVGLVTGVCPPWPRPAGAGRARRAGCHAEQSLRAAVPVRLQARLNGDDLQL